MVMVVLTDAPCSPCAGSAYLRDRKCVPGDSGGTFRVSGWPSMAWKLPVDWPSRIASTIDPVTPVNVICVVPLTFVTDKNVGVGT